MRTWGFESTLSHNFVFNNLQLFLGSPSCTQRVHLCPIVPKLSLLGSRLSPNLVYFDDFRVDVLTGLFMVEID